MEDETLQRIVGKSIESATSSLNSFTVAFSNGDGIALSPYGTIEEPGLHISLLPASQLPKATEAVCSVDWSWIYGSKIEAASDSNGCLQLKLNPAGPLKIWSAHWQGKPFLAFQPHSKP